MAERRLCRAEFAQPQTKALGYALFRTGVISSRLPLVKAAGGKAGAWLGIQKKDRDSDIDFPLFTLEKVRPDPQLQISEHGRYNTNCVFKAPQK